MPRRRIPSEPTPLHDAQRDYFRAVQRPEDRSPAWYLNLLAGTVEGPTPGLAPHTERQAACLWAGVDVADYTTQGALNIKAGNTSRVDWLSLRGVLTQLANRQTLALYKAAPGRLLTDRQALYAICRQHFAA